MDDVTCFGGTIYVTWVGEKYYYVTSSSSDRSFAKYTVKTSSSAAARAYGQVR